MSALTSSPILPSASAADMIGEILEAAKAQGMTQVELAKRAGIASETLSRLKRADDIRLSSLTQLAAVVGLRVGLQADHSAVERITSGELF